MIQKKEQNLLRRWILLFGIGMAVGMLFYFYFCNSFEGLEEQYKSNLKEWKRCQSYGKEIIHSLLQHGKYYALLWVLSVNRTASKWYERLFLLYTGICNGFLLLFFLVNLGMFGIICYLVSQLPQSIIFVPMYLEAFYKIRKKRQSRNKPFLWLARISLFGTACVLEVYLNLPWMESLLSAKT